MRLGRVLPVLLEIKLSPEESKSGLDPESPELSQLLERMPDLPGLKLRGLMTVPPWSEDPECARPYFHPVAAFARPACGAVAGAGLLAAVDGDVGGFRGGDRGRLDVRADWDGAVWEASLCGEAGRAVIPVRETDAGVTFAVRVQPGAKKTAITGVYGEGESAALKVALAAPPIDGRANEALVGFFAELL